MTSNSKLLIALLAGAAAGAALGLLFAPDEGKSTRTMIVDKSQELIDIIIRKAEEIIKGAEEAKTTR